MIQEIPDSHYWTTIEMLINDLEYNWNCLNGFILRDYLITGLQNTKKRGYDLRKKGGDSMTCKDKKPGKGGKK